MRDYILYLTIICLFGFGFSISVSAENYTFKGISMANGISDLLVNTIYKDSEGFVWFGTDNCLDRFDGVSIRHYPFSGDDLKKKRVNVIVEDQYKALWIGNDGGLWRLASETELPERMFEETIDCPVYSIYLDVNCMYIGTERGLFTYTGDILSQNLLHDNIFSLANKVYGSAKDDNGNLWLATADGLCKYEIRSGTYSFS